MTNGKGGRHNSPLPFPPEVSMNEPPGGKGDRPRSSFRAAPVIEGWFYRQNPPVSMAGASEYGGLKSQAAFEAMELAPLALWFLWRFPEPILAGPPGLLSLKEKSRNPCGSGIFLLERVDVSAGKALRLCPQTKTETRGIYQAGSGKGARACASQADRGWKPRKSTSGAGKGPQAFLRCNIAQHEGAA